MIKVNEEIVPINYFPDKTLRLKMPNSIHIDDELVAIEWKFENNEEMITLMFLTRQIQDSGYDVELYMPYIPNARQDRCENTTDIFTLKYFAEFINKLGFKWVHVFDPHSSVSTALIDRVLPHTPSVDIMDAIDSIAEREGIKVRDIVPCFPDAGAMKRYIGEVLVPPVYGNKMRDWETGKITGLQMMGDVNSVKDSIVLIIDDICSYGGTFYYSAKELKRLGAKKVYLYVSHCENSILQGKLFDGEEPLIERVYTTDTIFTEQSDKVEVHEYVF